MPNESSDGPLIIGDGLQRKLNPRSREAASVLFREPGSADKTMRLCDAIASPLSVLPLCFARRLRMDRKRVHGFSEFRRQRRINHAVALHPALPFEGRRHNIHSKMRFAARPVSGVALMQM